MPAVTGNVQSITGSSMDARDVVVRFTLNQGNIRVPSSGLRPDMWQDVTPDPSTGDFSINLQQTTDMALDAWYTVQILFQQSPSSTNGAGMALISYVDLKIRVPAGGGELSELIDYSAGGGGGAPGPNGRIVWVSQTPPPAPRPFMLWLQQEPGATVDPFDPRNTGILHEWRN